MGFCILVGLGFERIRENCTRRKLKPSVEKRLLNSCDNVNNNSLSQEPCQVSPDESTVTSSASKYVYEVNSDKDINHNDILASTTTIMSKPPKTTTTSSSSCSWWMLFLVNPSRRRQRIQPQQQSDSDILSNEAISHITFHCSHTNVSSNMKHSSILKARQVTAAVSVSNYELSAPQPKEFVSCATHLNILEETDFANLQNWDKVQLEENHRGNKSKHNFATHSSCIGVHREIYLVKFSKKKISKLLFNLLFLCTCIVLLFFVLKTWTRNHDWKSRKTLFR